MLSGFLTQHNRKALGLLLGKVINLKYDVSFLSKISKDLNNDVLVHEILTAVGRYKLKTVDNNFKFQSDPFGKPWLPSLAAIRASRLTLDKTGTLRGSIKFDVQGKELNVGTDISYAIYHQDPKPNAILPKRQFLGLGEKDKKEIDKIIFEYLESFLEKIRP